MNRLEQVTSLKHYESLMKEIRRSEDSKDELEKAQAKLAAARSRIISKMRPPRVEPEKPQSKEPTDWYLDGGEGVNISVQYDAVEKDITEFYEELTKALDGHVHVPSNHSNSVINLRNQTPQKSTGRRKPSLRPSSTGTPYTSTLSQKIPVSAPSNQSYMSSLVSKTVQRAASARRAVFCEPKNELPKSEKELRFDEGLLKILSPRRKETHVFHDDQFHTPKDMPKGEAMWRVPSRPQTAISHAMENSPSKPISSRGRTGAILPFSLLPMPILNLPFPIPRDLSTRFRCFAWLDLLVSKTW